MDTGLKDPFVNQQMTESRKAQDKESTCSKVVNTLKKDWVLILTVAGIAVGFSVGLAIRPTRPSQDVLLWIGMPGEIFLRMLRLIIIPLIAASIIAGTASSDPKSNGKISGIALAYITITNLIGAILGLFLGLAVKPGMSVAGSDKAPQQLSSSLSTQDIIADLIRNIFPENIFKATIQKTQTMYEEEMVQNVTNGTVLKLVRTVAYVDSPNILGIIFISIVFGIAAGFAREKGRPFLLFFTSLTDIIMIVMNWFMWTSPIGIASLIASTLGGIEDLKTTFIRLGALIGTVVGGCAFHQIIIIPLIILMITRRNPLPAIFKAAKPWLVALSTTSSAVSTPAIFESCEKLGVDQRVSAVAVPLAVTLNREGSALFVAVVVLFLGQISQVTLNGGQYILIIILTWISALALPAVPSASLVTIVIICTTLAIPSDTIGLLFAVDWFQDRVRTSSNVLSSTMCAYITNHLTRTEIQKMDEKDLDVMKLRNVDDLNDHYITDNESCKL